MFQLSRRAYETPCKCCGGAANLYGVVDFSKSCEERRGLFLPVTGIPVYYYRCAACGFMFTRDFDEASGKDIAELVYNREYSLVDPDFQEARPKAIANLLLRYFGNYREELSILDYGCGNGTLGRCLEEAGFRHIVNYDPFIEKFSSPPDGSYDLILCFEVLEHSIDPRRIISDLVRYRKDDGIVMHSTLLQPETIDSIKLGWWYAGPRNGHFSLFSKESLVRFWKETGLEVASANADMHVAFSRLPAFAGKLVRRA